MAKKEDILFSAELIDILTKAAESKIYGSVEIYYEAGNITQITKREIKKMSKKAEHSPVPQNSKSKPVKKSLKSANRESNPTILTH